MNKWLKATLFGLILWIIPFLASFPFVDAQGNFLISETFFKTIMIVISSATGVILAARYFLKTKIKDPLKEGIILGCIWLAINLIIDLIFVAVGFFNMSVLQYFTDIGLRYLSALFYTTGIGYIVKYKKRF